MISRQVMTQMRMRFSSSSNVSPGSCWLAALAVGRADHVHGYATQKSATREIANCCRTAARQASGQQAKRCTGRQDQANSSWGSNGVLVVRDHAFGARRSCLSGAAIAPECRITDQRL